MSGPQGTGPDPAWSPAGASGEQNPPDPYGAQGTYPQQSPYAPPSPYGQYPGAGAYPPPEQYPGTGASPQYGQYPPPPAGQYPSPPGQYPGTGQQPQYGGPQYGAPQYGGGYGQPQYGEAGYGAGPYPPPPGFESNEPKKSPKVVYGVIGGLAAVILAAVAVLGFWKPGFFVTTELSASGAQQGVSRVLGASGSDGFGAQNVSNVVCNDGADITVEDGGTFSCTVSIDGSDRTVTATFRGTDGTYEVGRPR